MHKKDRDVIISRYEARLKKFGPTPQALGWFRGRQNFRFHFIAEIEGLLPVDSILDVGCAFGDLYLFMRSRSWNGEYCGIDIVPGLIEEGKRRYPNLDLKVMDIQNERPKRKFDWVFCSGALTSKTVEVDSHDHAESMLSIMFDLCKKGVSVNFLSPYIEYESEINFHPDLTRILDMISRLTKRFTLRHDYMPYELTVYLYKDSEILKEANIFRTQKDIYDKVQKLTRQYK